MALIVRLYLLYKTLDIYCLLLSQLHNYNHEYHAIPVSRPFTHHKHHFHNHYHYNTSGFKPWTQMKGKYIRNHGT